MGKLAFLYPGQGSQRVGMGSDLLAARPDLFDAFLARADEAAGVPVRRYCLEGPIEALTETQVAQPALFALSSAITVAALDAGLRPDFVGGHSLGEYTAAVASGALEFEEGLALVCLRGRLMSEIQASRPGAMGAVMGLGADLVVDLCRQASEAGVVTVANLNSPAQIVVSGAEAAVERALELARQAGATKCVRLQVGAAFHSPLMEPVQAALAATMKDLAWVEPTVPLVANWSGRVVTTADGIREALVAQIASPVRWVDCMQTLADAGCSTLVELGPGRVLTGLARQISPDADAFAADSPPKLVALLGSRPALAPDPAAPDPAAAPDKAVHEKA